jgi:membrane fusion protein (multidrug efflux system)
VKKVIFISVAIGALIALYFFMGQDKTGPERKSAGGRPPFGGPVQVVAEPVSRQPLVKVIEALGTSRANESVTLTASLNETVRRVNFEDGDFVEAGAVLVELSDEEEEAQLAEARANLNEARRQLTRLEDLDKQGIAAASDVDGARSQAEAAQARLNSVSARLDDRLITAPFSGVLGFREVSPGSLLMSGDPITTLDDVSQIKLDFTVPETVLNQMKLGSKILARSASWGDREFAGIVRAVGSRVDPVTRAVSVRALIQNEDRALRPGMLLTVRVVTEEKQAFMLPERVVVQVGKNAFVYAVDSKNVAHRQAVQLGTRQKGNVEIVAGISEGDRIVTQGVIKLRDGVPVMFADEATALAKKGRPRGRPSE